MVATAKRRLKSWCWSESGQKTVESEQKGREGGKYDFLLIQEGGPSGSHWLGGIWVHPGCAHRTHSPSSDL